MMTNYKDENESEIGEYIHYMYTDCTESVKNMNPYKITVQF